MVFDIYFHNDFDGRASAAIILAWLKQRGDRAGKLMPIDYSLTPAWLQPNFFTGRRPTIVVDYPYHPGAAMWFDHHPTTFKRADWQRQFRQDKSHRFESRYHSCAHQVYDALRKDFGFRPPVVIKKLIPWADIEDSAGYRSAKQAVLSREPAFRIRTYMDQPANKRRPLQWLITALGEKSLDEITKDVRVRAAYRRYRTSLLNAISFYRTHLKRQNGI
ncbi:MAG: hypothetical protein HY978_03500, partial [Candidatus Liptonbacteria bacterium]|nr:hypothetical protein [Candidatus Liptonbacteria bacterium]